MLSDNFFIMHVNILPYKKFGLHVPSAPFSSLFFGCLPYRSGAVHGFVESDC